MKLVWANGVVGALSAAMLASSCDPGGGQDRTLPSVEQASESLLLARPVLASLELSPGAVVGGQTINGTVALTSRAPAQGSRISLRSSDDDLAPVPNTVLIPAGTSSASFAISTRPVTHLRVATITASLGGLSRIAVLRLNPPPSCFGVVCAPPNQCQASVSCNLRTRRCSYTPKPAGAACDDGNPDTVNDECNGGSCAGIPLPADDPSTPGDDRPGRITCLDGSTCQDRCCEVGPHLDWVCATGGVCPADLWGQVSCDGPEDCPTGQVCCPMPDELRCQATCPVDTICHADRDCPTGQVCSGRSGPWGQCAAQALR
jgi:hypothetical protein